MKDNHATNAEWICFKLSIWIVLKIENSLDDAHWDTEKLLKIVQLDLNGS